MPAHTPDACNTAAEDAVFGFLLHPGAFDAHRAGLGAYLRMAARRDLLNVLAKERRVRRGIPLDSVAEPADPRNRTPDGELTWDDPRLVAERATFDATESAVLELMRNGTRDTATFARPLGVEHLPAKEQAVEVKRVKDRVKKRLARALEDS